MKKRPPSQAITFYIQPLITLYPNPNIHPGVVRCIGLGYAWIGKAIAEIDL